MNVLIFGGTGHSNVIRPILKRNGHRIVGLFDANPEVGLNFAGPVYRNDTELEAALPGIDGFIVCIGRERGQVRHDISYRLMDMGLLPVEAVHHTAYLSETSTRGIGLQMLEHAVVGEQVTIGNFCILNTNCAVAHDCVIGNGVHIMVGANLAGEVVVEDHASISTNATILPHVRIGRGAIVGAGAVVTRDVPPGMVVTGVPAKPLQS